MSRPQPLIAHSGRRRGRAPQGRVASGSISSGRRSRCWTACRTPRRGRCCADDGERATFYAGPAEIELYRTETAYYRDNLATGSPALWVVMQRDRRRSALSAVAVTADPAEGEGFTETGANLVEQVPMPDIDPQIVAAFVAEHHVERAVLQAQARPRQSGIAGAARPDGGSRR